MNPVFERELRQRFRGRPMWLVIAGWVIVVGLLGYSFFVMGRRLDFGSFIAQGPLSGLNQAGQWLFDGLALVLLTAIMFIVPGFTALSIVGERERQTLSLVQVTQITPLGIVLGKLYSSVGFAVVLLVSVIPLLAIPLAFGAIGMMDVLVVLAMLLLTLVMLASVSIWVSSRAKSNRAAVTLSHLLAVAIFLGSFVLMGAEALAIRADNVEVNGRELVSTWINPYVAMADAVVFPYDNLLGLDSIEVAMPMDPFVALVSLRQTPGGSRQGEVRADGGLLGFRRVPGWIATTLIYGLIIALCLWRAARRVTTPRAPVRLKRARASNASS